MHERFFVQTKSDLNFFNSGSEIILGGIVGILIHRSTEPGLLVVTATVTNIIIYTTESKIETVPSLSGCNGTNTYRVCTSSNPCGVAEGN